MLSGAALFTVLGNPDQQGVMMDERWTTLLAGLTQSDGGPSSTSSAIPPGSP